MITRQNQGLVGPAVSPVILAKRQTDGTLVQTLPDGSTQPLKDDTDWARVDAMKLVDQRRSAS